MKRLKAIVLSLMMAVLTVFGAVADFQPVFADENELTVRFHYQRPDGEYTDWDMWIWPQGADGNGYAFTGTDDFGVYLDYKMGSGSAVVNYIVRKGGSSWLEKDVDSDRNIDLSRYIKGTVHVYLTSKVVEPTVDEKDVVIGCKVKSMEVKSRTEIVATLSTEPAEGTDMATAFTVKDTAGNAIDVVSAEKNGLNVTIKLGSELDYLKSYKLTFTDIEYTIPMPEYFSTEEFEGQYTYEGNDLGATWTQTATTFKVWAPVATTAKVNIYTSGTEGTDDLENSYDMKQEDKGVWAVTVEGDLNGKYYTYTVNVNGKDVESIDPYATTAGVNGKRGMVLDHASTNPEGWENDKRPNSGLSSYTDAVLYELHVRDFSYEASSGVSEANRGKYLAFTEHGTTNASGQATGIDYLKDLGINYVHLLPTYDYGSVDESKLDVDQFNWGYDPVNYNVPEGSYSTDPYDGAKRVKEYKQMVKSLHDAGIGVVCDVVYNHVYNAGEFSMNVITPGYYVRPNSNASGCGNDVASERNMVRKYIVESVVYWAKEYHIDGFRFDLVGLLDCETINQIVTEVHKIDPSIIFYGEGWNMSSNVTKQNVPMANQQNAKLTPGFAYFSDSMRDTIKGSTFDGEVPGYINGSEKGSASALVNNVQGKPGWELAPTQVVNYESCHDNYTIYDKLQMTCKNASDDELLAMNKLAASLVLTTQGIPLMHAGEEILRTKEKEDGTFEHNSYNKASSLNSIKWDTLADERHQDSLAYYKGLIKFRSTHAAMRLSTREDVDKYMTILENGKNEQSVVAFKLSGDAANEISDGIIVIYNPSSSVANITLPDGKWKVCVNEKEAGLATIGFKTGVADVAAKSCMVLCQGDTGSDEVRGMDLSNTSVTISKDVHTYTGKAIKPTVTVKDGSDKLVLGTDYTVTYKDNTNIGKATIIVEGKGTYQGSKTLTFTIQPAKVAGLKQYSKYSTDYVRMSWTAMKGVDGYLVYRATSQNGKYSALRRTEYADYADFAVTEGRTYYYKIRGYKTIDGKKVYGSYSNAVKMVAKSAPVKVTLTAGSKKMTVKWTKANGADGYEVYLSSSLTSGYAKKKTTSSSTFSASLTGLKSGRTYYVKVKSFKYNAAGKKVYSDLSDVRAVKVK